MNIIFLSNYFNHHQKAFCEELYAKLGNDFAFISTRPMGDERRKLGYSLENCPAYVKYAYIDNAHLNRCRQLIDNADVVIAGSAPEEFLKNRCVHEKLTFRYSERLYRKGFAYYKWPVRAWRFWQRYSRKKGQYLLCASAYTAADFAITGNFRNKAYKWGYFPETVCYDPEQLVQKKDRKKLLWCGRFIDLKHPEDVIEIAKRLKAECYDFQLDCIGTGESEQVMKELIHSYGLEENVRLLGAMKPEQVRRHMETAGIYLFTSDFQEGWGAVLNESMNSGCAVVASHAIGSAPYLLKDGENGLLYRYGDGGQLYDKVKFLLDNPDAQRRLGKAAYYTIADLWNAETAADRFLKLAEQIQTYGFCDLYEDGPCSKAGIIKNNWFRG